MNQSPMNYLVALLLAAVIWVITGVILANPFAESIPFATIELELFRSRYQMMLGIASFLSFILAAYWFSYGGKESTVGDLEGAKRTWKMLFIVEIILAVASALVMIIMHLNEGLSGMAYLILIAVFSLSTFIYFWLCSFLMSPKGVKYVVLFRG